MESDNTRIILTKSTDEGQRLKNALTLIDPSFESIECITKDDINGLEKRLANVTHIFSSWYMPDFTAAEVSAIFPRLEAVFYAAGTVKYFASSFWANNIKIYAASNANGLSVAEFTAAQIILANKGYFQASRRYHWPIWTKGFGSARKISERKFGNYRATVGIVGCGMIGSKVIELLKDSDLQFLVYDPYVPKQRLEELGAESVDLETLFKSSDVISNHLPDTEATRGIIDFKLLNKMKPTATFINTGRGQQVNESDLARVMRRNKSMCALLDVTSHEPLFPWSRLYFCRNVFLSPHIAGSLSNEYNRMAQQVLEAYKADISGQHCDFLVPSTNPHNHA